MDNSLIGWYLWMYVLIKYRSLVFSPMQSELLVANGLKRSMELSIATFFEFPSEMRRELFASGSHDLKSGHI